MPLRDPRNRLGAKTTRFFWPQESIVRANASGGGCGGLAGRRRPAHRHSPFIALTTR